MRELLAPLVKPNYVVRVERRVYVDHEWDSELLQHIRPDVVLVDTGLGQKQQIEAAAGTALLQREVPMPQQREETYLVIRSVIDSEMVCVIETLSPSNKRANGDGRRAYLQKRDEVLASKTHLVEIDFLRGGVRLPILGGEIPGDHYVVVSPSYRRPRVDVYSWPLHESIPDVMIPLKREDGSVKLSMQTAYNMVYDRANYEGDPSFRRIELSPPLSPENAIWASRVLAASA
jgi:hypothetical protein